MDNRASLAVQVRTNIRCKNIITYQEIVGIFKKQIPFSKQYQKYMLAFFEECYPSLIKKFMLEQNINKKEIMEIFKLLPKDFGESKMFQEKINNGKF